MTGRKMTAQKKPDAATLAQNDASEPLASTWLSGSMRTPNSASTPRTSSRTAATTGENSPTSSAIGAETAEAARSGLEMA